MGTSGVLGEFSLVECSKQSERPSAVQPKCGFRLRVAMEKLHQHIGKKEGAHDHFAELVDDYDTVASAVVIANDEIHRCMFSALPFAPSDEIRVLDLGCGTGQGLDLALSRFPNATAVGVDFSKRMLERCAKRLQSDSDRITLVEQEIESLRLSEKFDLIISSFTLHNLTRDAQRVVLARLHEFANVGAIFVNSDFVLIEDANLYAHLREVYVRFVRQNLYGAELNAWLAHIATDTPLQISVAEAVLSANGFDDFRLLSLVGDEVVYQVRRQ